MQDRCNGTTLWRSASFLLIPGCFHPCCNPILWQKLSHRLCIWSAFTDVDMWIEIQLSVSVWSTFHLSGVASGVCGVCQIHLSVQPPFLPLHLSSWWDWWLDSVYTSTAFSRDNPFFPGPSSSEENWCAYFGCSGSPLSPPSLTW